MSRSLSLEDLLAVKGAPRTVRAYAFLEASLSVAENSPNPARDALDCFLPFVASGVASQHGSQLDLAALQKYLKTNFGFDIPIYALEQFIPELQAQGTLQYDPTLRSHLCKGDAVEIMRGRKEIHASFDGLESSLASFASQEGLPSPPHSQTWLDGLIAFLRAVPDEAAPKAVTVKKVLTKKGPEIERYVIGKFVEEAHRSNREAFSAVLSVFKGVIIEDFVSVGVQLADAGKVNDLTIYYDTALLMRLLGCSGSLLQTATSEIHRYIQDAGSATKCLPITESEVSNIIATLLGVRDQGRILYGETAEAIESGECSITHLRLLNGRFVEKLAEINVFESKDNLSRIHDLKRFQIDEKGFDDYLRTEAERRSKDYGADNRRNDAQVLGTVMQFRRGHKSRDLLKCKFLFVTNNKFLAVMSRRFLINEKELSWSDCAPILHVGQLATVVWLLKNKGLDDQVVTRDLLVNCAVAYRPDPDWFEHFIDAVEKVGGDSIVQDGIALQAARRIAQDQTYGRTALLPQVNTTEILERARQDKEKLAAESLARGRLEGAEGYRRELFQEQEKKAGELSRLIVRGLEVFVLFVFLVATSAAAASIVFDVRAYLPDWLWVSIAAVTGLGSVISILDMFGWQIVEPMFEKLRMKVAARVLRVIQGGNK